MNYKPIRYDLEIYANDNQVDAAAILRDTTPFPHFAVGDLIAGNGLQNLGSGPLMVTGTQHILQEHPDHISHRLCVYAGNYSGG